MGIRLLTVFAVVGLLGCGGGPPKDPYQPRMVGEDPSGPGLGVAANDDTDGDGDSGAKSSIGSAKSDAKTNTLFKMRKCSQQCIQTWNARSKSGAQPAIRRDCEHRCKRRWFTCGAAITNALVIMRQDQRRRDVLIRDGDKAVRADGLRQCKRSRWGLDTLGCMIQAKRMAAFDECEDEGRKRRRQRRRLRKRR